MPLSTLRHPEHHIRQLRRLANRPVKKHHPSIRVHTRRVDNHVLNSDVEVNRATEVRVLGVDDVVCSEVVLCFEDGWVLGISHDYRADVEL